MFWRQLRLAGAVICIAAFIFKNLNLVCVGLMFTAVGVVNGLFFLEEEVKRLKEKLHAEDKTPKSH